MSRLCRLKNATHGHDGVWAYAEITRLREKLKVAEEALEKAVKYIEGYGYEVGECYQTGRKALAKIRSE